MTKTKLTGGFPFISYSKDRYQEKEMLQKSQRFYQWLNQRRSVRDFSSEPVPRAVMEQLIMAASAAPSGAHKQPWTFCMVGDPVLKKKIRKAAEEEEYTSYNGRMPEEWLTDLRPLQTDWKKEFLEIAPWLIIVFRKSYELQEDKRKRSNYYVSESCGIACGFLLAAIHEAGLAALTHTPSPMNFLAELLQRPENEKPFLLIPVGYPAAECWVPDIQRKSIEAISAWYE
jgi:iodotyrosine deiodinase